MTDLRTLWVGTALAAVNGADPTHRAVLVEGGVITWTGVDPSAAPDADRVVDLGTAWLMPGFVDAHVHATATGLQAAGLDLADATSAAEVVQRVGAHARRHRDTVIYGAGWDDLGWPEGRPPSADELAAAAPGRTVLLVRVDGHSCLVDRSTLDALDLRGHDDLIDRDADGRPTGWLLEGASAVAQAAMRARLTPAQVDQARRATCRLAAGRGVTTIHEMGIPALSDRADAMAWATGDWPIEVIAYWAALEVDPDGVLLPGGDLFLDGSIGSCTAATSLPYATNDGRGVTGMLFHDDEVVAAFFRAATTADVGAGVHAIGDRAVDQAVRALHQVARDLGVPAVRRARHRIEHLELADPGHLSAMADLGVVASVQPAFDAVWNGPGGLYEQRFGRDRADRSNPIRWIADAGVGMCFSSDSTVTPLDPWAGVLAAERHHGGLGIDRSTALRAATIGGHHAVRRERQAGAILPGMRADLVAWPGDPVDDDPTGWHPVVTVAGGLEVT